MVNRVYWNDAEKRQVATASFHLLAENRALTNMAAIEQAQRKVLKPNRRRELSTSNFSHMRPWIEPLWHEIGTRQEQRAEAKANVESLFAPALEVPAEVTALEPVTLSIPTVVDATPDEPTGQAEQSPRTVVRWSDTEKRKLAARIHYLTQAFAGMSRLEALRKANESELPAHRQRDIDTWRHVKTWLDPLLEQAQIEDQLNALQAKAAREEAERGEREAQAQAKEAEEAEEAEPTTFEARGEAEEPQRSMPSEPRPLALPPLARAAPLHEMIQTFADGLAAHVVEALTNALGQALMRQMSTLTLPAINLPTVGTVATEPPEKPVAPPRERLPRVTIVGGLYSQQVQEMEKAFLGTIDFVFIKSLWDGAGGNSSGGHGLLTRGANSDLVLLAADKIGHDVTDAAKRLKVPYYRVSGGYSSLKRWLASWLAGENPQAGQA